LGLAAGTNAKDTESVSRLVQHVVNRFSMVMIEEHFDESLVLFRRTGCWPMEEIGHPVAPPPTAGERSSQPALSLCRLGAVAGSCGSTMNVLLKGEQGVVKSGTRGCWRLFVRSTFTTPHNTSCEKGKF
jgi:hypothetical protein